MAFARIYSAQAEVLSGTIVSVEVDIGKGLNAFSIVGLGDRAVEEARDRVSSALRNAGFESPKSKNQKTVVSLSPASLKKEGSHFDLAMAIGFLAAEGIPLRPIGHSAFIGELALDGSVHSVRGALPMALAAHAAGLTEIFVPSANKEEAALVDGIAVYPVASLRQLADHLSLDIRADENSEREEIRRHVPEQEEIAVAEERAETNFGEILGQEGIKRGLAIAAAGGHNVLLYGPPGTGKTMLSKALAGVLPELGRDESIRVAAIHSIAGNGQLRVSRRPPFRAPHHTSSAASVLGGGSPPRAGEVTLAHLGVLFMDEFPEFDRRVIESLRQPLEEHSVTISRTKGSVTFPAEFIFVAAMNPCPCGYKGSASRSCTCTTADILRYKRKLSGPLLDRIDIALHVGEIRHGSFDSGVRAAESEGIRKKIGHARQLAFERCAAEGIQKKINSRLSSEEARKCIALGRESRAALDECAARLSLSMRAYRRTERLARTIADLDDSADVLPSHVYEAVRYRPQPGLF